MRKKGTKNKNYSAEFKIAVIMNMRNQRLGYCETVRKYNLGSTKTGGAIQMIQRWERIYLEEGEQGLMAERRGRKSTGRPRKKPLDNEVENDLIAENQRLRMELEYLKKLSALVLAEEQEKNKKQ